MLQYTQPDPIALSLGPLQVRWYGLMYLVGFLGGWWLARQRGRSSGLFTVNQADDLLFYMVLGVVLGGRIGYVLFYQWGRFLHEPGFLLRIWEGGMSFHGGLLGVLLALWLLSRRQGREFFAVTDFVAPLVPIGLGAGRIGNFINGELWGRSTDLAWGMQVPCARFPELCANLAADALWSLPLHPSQIYQAVLEGPVLFAILWWFSARSRPTMAVSGLFLLGYGSFRVVTEFFRQPDVQLGFIAFDWLTMGQLLSLPMIAGGLALLAVAYRRAGPAA